MQRYLQYETLRKQNLTNFDAWASVFGETVTAIELAPEGTGYRARTRFAKFYNLPELMNMFREVADIKTADQLHLPTPNAHYETVVVQPSEIQKRMVQELSKRAAKIHGGAVDPHIDNMLKVSMDGKKLGLDQRLINPMLPDDPGSKVNACVGNVMRIYREGSEQKLTQLIFSDMSTPKNGQEKEFSVYHDNVLSRKAVQNVVGQYGFDRTLYVLAVTVMDKNWDGRISQNNKNWAKMQPVYADVDELGQEKNQAFVARSHPGLVDLFLRETRRAKEANLEKNTPALAKCKREKSNGMKSSR